MNNISLNKESIILKAQAKYFVIDALYLNDVKDAMQDLNLKNLANEIRGKVFSYNDTPFVEYSPNVTSFAVEQITKVDSIQAAGNPEGILSTDTGVLVFVNEQILIDFIEKYDYNQLVESDVDLINIEYWKAISQEFDFSDTAIILSPGIGAGVDFDGSGIFRVV